VGQYLLWIDLSRYVAEALEQLGHESTGEMVAAATADYVSRLRGIEKLAFSDGTPFADVETREWIKQLLKKSAGSEGSSGGTGLVEQVVNQELAEGLKMIKENKLANALIGFKENLNRASSIRNRFVWELGLCRLLLRAKKIHLAVPHIHAILQAIEDFKVEKWEPEMAVEALAVALSGLRLDKENLDEELMKTILDRISVLNPVRALDLE